MSKLFSLLVGINHYHPASSVPALAGCANDVRGMHDFLQDTFKDRHETRMLLDGQATYAEIVRAFGKDHLGQAGADDIVLFAYSGHGSREPAAPEFRRYFPEGLQETLVCYDSRTTGGLDLADKELSWLIDSLARKGAQVVVLLDCCHSGSGTRALEDFTLGNARQTSDKTQARAWESYLDGQFAQKFPGGEAIYLPNSRHILLAACDRREKAWETTNKQGLFSTQLAHILQTTGGRLSYADLFTQSRLRIAQVTDRQHPQFEPYGYFNSYGGFLGLSGGSAGAPVKVYFADRKWQVNLGAIHGLPPSAERPSTFALSEGDKALGHARTLTTGVEESNVLLEGFDGDPAKIYDARLTSLPAAPMLMQLEAPADLSAKTQEALVAFKPLYFALEENAPHAPYCLRIAPREMQLLRTTDGLRLRTIEGDDWDKMLADAFEKMEHIARWEKTISLDNPGSKINTPGQQVELLLVELDAQGQVLHKHQQEEVIIDILTADGKEQPVPFRLEVRNNHPSRPRYCAIFYGASNYRLFSVGFNEEIPPGATMVAWERTPKGNPLSFTLNGKNEEVDLLKMFVSNRPIKLEALEQKPLRIGETVSFWRTRGAGEGLSGAKGVSDFDDEPTVEVETDDWHAFTMKVKCVARQASVGEREVPLANGAIKVLPHPSFRAGLGMSTAFAGSRSVEPMAVIAELAQSAGFELLQFSDRSRSADPAANMLELSDLNNEDSLAEQPLEIEIDAGLRQNENVEDLLLPMTFDGEHLLPIGLVERLEGGKARVQISHLPEKLEEPRRRSLGKALRLCFMKLVLQKKEVQQLRWVDFSGEKSERKSTGLNNKVAAANKVLLLLHGIIGDTKDMAECMRQAYVEQRYDLVLTFDYENLHTPIEETAQRLSEMLKEAGFSAGSGKELTILAHSMGGLVSRYFIEQLDGRQLVTKLIMAGTPNAGSAIAKLTKYRDYATILLGFAVNSPLGLAGAATALAILNRSKLVTATLAQMNEDSPFLQGLNGSADPGLPYRIVAGRLSGYLSKNEDAKKLMDKLLHLGAKAFYGQEENDIAVSLDSIAAVPASRQPAIQEVACHHLNYFEDAEGVAAVYAMME
jgi:pimeloyl-ACP methyl ester carboxylesterase